MKEYLVWLLGGNCIEGSADEDELLQLKNSWLAYKCSGGEPIAEFDDSDGPVAIDFTQIQAISINEKIENKNVGYKS